MFIWFINLFTKKGRKQNYFETAERRLRKVALKKTLTRSQTKKKVIDQVKAWQNGPKKSYYELEQLSKHKGLKQDCRDAGVKVNWKKMLFVN